MANVDERIMELANSIGMCSSRGQETRQAQVDSLLGITDDLRGPWLSDLVEHRRLGGSVQRQGIWPWVWIEGDVSLAMMEGVLQEHGDHRCSNWRIK